MEPIINLHSEIIGKINNFRSTTSKVMIDQERDIKRFFINKINEIKKEYEEERIRKGKKWTFSKYFNYFSNNKKNNRSRLFREGKPINFRIGMD